MTWPLLAVFEVILDVVSGSVFLAVISRLSTGTRRFGKMPNRRGSCLAQSILFVCPSTEVRLAPVEYLGIEVRFARSLV